MWTQFKPAAVTKVFLCAEPLIMVLSGAEVAVACLNESMESPFIDGIGIEWFVEGRSNEGFDDQPASELTLLGGLAIISQDIIISRTHR
jgi:hypothetical protein